jgi:hypothetical protein
MADEFESRILKCHEEKKEQNLAVKNAQAHQKRCNMAPNVEDDLEKHENQCKVPMDSSCEETSADNGMSNHRFLERWQLRKEMIFRQSCSVKYFLQCENVKYCL